MVTHISEENNRRVNISGTLYEYEEYDRFETGGYNKQHIISPNVPSRNGVVDGFFEARLTEEKTWNIRWHGDITPVGVLKSDKSEEVALFLDTLERSFNTMLISLTRYNTSFIIEETRISQSQHSQN